MQDINTLNYNGMTKKQRLIFHLGFWFFILFYNDILQAIGNPNYEFSWRWFRLPFGLSSLFFQFAVTYTALWVINRYFDTKAYARLIIGLVAVIAGYIFFRFLIEENLTVWIWGSHNYTYSESFTWLYYITDSAYNGVGFLILAVPLKMVEDFFKNEKIKRELQTEKTSAELAFLKSQLNPHFLFNTLNNIYVLAYQKSDQTPAAMLKLSEIMRYMLYESNEEKVGLKQEVKYLQNIIALQKMRYNSDVFIETTFQGDFESNEIAPLLLAPFVENAFKHGEVSDRDNPVIIRFLESKGNLHFYIKNKKSKAQKDETGGVGLNNVRRRLDLLYPEKYSLDIFEDDAVYQCELNLILN